jgi:hypothetical protein
MQLSISTKIIGIEQKMRVIKQTDGHQKKRYLSFAGHKMNLSLLFALQAHRLFFDHHQ